MPKSARPAWVPIIAWLICGALAVGAGALTVNLAGQAWQRHQVASGAAGIPGAVTLTGYGYFRTGSSRPSEDCVGRFVPDSGGPPDARVFVDGFGRASCTPGEVVRAHLLKGDGGGGVGLDTNDYDEAFVPGHSTGSGGAEATIATLFALITLVLAFPWLRLTYAAVRAPFRRTRRVPQT